MSETRLSCLDAGEMHHAHVVGDSGAETRLCPCGVEFVARKPWQRFHAAACRRSFHAVRTEHGLRAKVSSVKILKCGVVSVVLRFDVEDRGRAQQLTPGAGIQVLST
jgi:hypothetical protein